MQQPRATGHIAVYSREASLSEDSKPQVEPGVNCSARRIRCPTNQVIDGSIVVPNEPGDSSGVVCPKTVSPRWIL